MENASSATNAKIKQYSFDRTSPGIRWLITPTASGAYKLTCKAAEGTNMVMIVPSATSGNNGTDLIQYPYANNTVYRDEWRMAEIKALSSTPLEGQQKSNWCWAAASRMFAKHYYPGVTRTQAEMVKQIKNSYVAENVTGSMQEISKAIRYYIDDQPGKSNYIGVRFTQPSVYSESQLKEFLDDNDVVIANRFFYENINDPSTKSDMGHDVLIAGYVEINGKTYFLLKDPLPVNNGSTELISYEKLYYGANSQQGEEDNNWVWYASVLLNRDDANNTIPYHFDNN